jgi:hypothetical protein
MPSPEQTYANKKFAKQGLSPHSAGQGPSIGNEEIFGHQSDSTDASGHKLGEVTRASEDTNGPDPDFHPSALSDMMSKYGAAVKKYAGGN